MRTTIAAFAVTAGLVGGALIGAPILSAAAPGDPRPAPAAGAPNADERPAKAKDRENWAKKAMDDLVAKGTITQAQADAVFQALKDARPDKGKRPGGVKAVIRHEALHVAATALGMTQPELRVEIRAGKSIAQVAQARGVDLKKVTDALVAAGTEQIGKLVTAGEITQAQADKRIASLPGRIDAFVNRTHPAKLNP